MALLSQSSAAPYIKQIINTNKMDLPGHGLSYDNLVSLENRPFIDLFLSNLILLNLQLLSVRYTILRP